jgi:hypothetical protein
MSTLIDKRIELDMEEGTEMGDQMIRLPEKR